MATKKNMPKGMVTKLLESEALRKESRKLKGAETLLDKKAVVEVTTESASDRPAATVDPVSATLAQRGRVHGDYTENARITQALKRIVRESPGYRNLTADKAQTIEVILDKISRILSGDPEFTDHWHDIQGYARLSENRCSTLVPSASTTSPE